MSPIACVGFSTGRLLSVIMVGINVSPLVGCGAETEMRVRPRADMFEQRRTIPLVTGNIGALICNHAFKEHGSHKGWNAACGSRGYYLSQTFLIRTNRVLEINQTYQKSMWVDPDGQQVAVMPTYIYNSGGRRCRTFRATVEIRGQLEIMTGEACRDTDGNWRIAQ